MNNNNNNKNFDKLDKIKDVKYLNLVKQIGSSEMQIYPSDEDIELFNACDTGDIETIDYKIFRKQVNYALLNKKFKNIPVVTKLS